MDFTMGKNTGMKINSTEIQSRIKPARKQINKNNANAAHGGNFAPSISSSANDTPPYATKTPANMLPPNRIIKIIQVTFKVLSTASLRILMLNVW